MKRNHFPLPAITCLALLLSPAAAQDAFDVASVKSADPIRNPVVYFRAYPGGRVVITNYTLKMMIADAYALPYLRVTGGPRWVDEDLYDVTAKPPAGTPAASFTPPGDYAFPPPALLTMVRTLLADRFGLKLHREMRQFPVLALVIGKHGTKLQPARDPSADPLEPHRKEQHEWRSITMQRLAAKLEARYNQTVLDHTGLTGSYDFDLTYDPQLRDTDDNNDVPMDPTRISLKSALETQIGLKLEPTKAPLEILVIDEVKRP